jgi:glutathione reductase (NADPH)
MIPIPGIELCLDSDKFFALEELPNEIVIVGNGYIGSELAGLLHSFGVKVTICVLLPDYGAPTFDSEITTLLSEEMQHYGIDIFYNLNSTSITEENGIKTVHFQGTDVTYSAPEIIYAIGRVPNIQGFNLEGIGVKTKRIPPMPTCIDVDEF